MRGSDAAKAWITGAGGLIGHELARLAPMVADRWQVIPLSRQDLELTDFAAVDRRFKADEPDLVIHCAALSRSPACQADPALAQRLNVDVTRHLAGLMAGRLLVFFSSDLVFDGRTGGYVETDAPNPLSVYAETKVAAERFVLAQPGQVVVRTSLNYGHSPTGDRAFNEEMLRAVREGARLRLFTDEYRCPISAEVTARAVWALVQSLAPGGAPGPRAEIFHLAGAERLSRWSIGEWLARLEPALRGRMEASSLTGYQGAPRPPDTSLNCAKLQALLEFPLPRFSQWVAARIAGRDGRPADTSQAFGSRE